MTRLNLRLICILSALTFGAAAAQTAVHTAPKYHFQRCGDDEDLADCGMQAQQNKDYDVARDAWSRAAEQGDHTAAFWLAGLYEDGHGGVEQFLVQAYKWYDIAAAMHGIEIDKLPPGSLEDNKAEINYRNAVAEQMTPAQIADAQRMAREWMAHTTNTRSNRP